MTLVLGGTASAASLDLSADPQTNSGADITLNITGLTDQDGSWGIWVHDVAIPCGATADEENTGNGGGPLGEAVEFRLNLEADEAFDDDVPFTPEVGESYRFCALLGDFNQNGANPPDARDEVVVCRSSAHLDGGMCVADAVSVSGTGNPRGLNFPAQPAGTTSPPQTVTITSAIDGLIPGPVLQSTDAANFQIVNDQCTNIRLETGESCTFGVRFTPDAARVFLANVDLNCFDDREEPSPGSDCDPPEVDLRGVGAAGGSGGGGGGGPGPSSSSGSNPSSSSGSNQQPPPPPTESPPTALIDLGPLSSGFAFVPKRLGSSAVNASQAGASFRFNASEPAAATITIVRQARGLFVDGSCVRRTRARRVRNPSAPRCAYRSPRGRIGTTAQPGHNRLAYVGRNPISGRPLRPGLYRATLVLTDSIGQLSAGESAFFRILRPRR